MADLLTLRTLHRTPSTEIEHITDVIRNALLAAA
jgi:hypothetical protein